MRLYIDDERTPAHPGDWTIVRSVDEAIEILSSNSVEMIDLDWYMGTGARFGHEVLEWMLERVKTDPSYTPPRVRIHTIADEGKRRLKELNFQINGVLQARTGGRSL